jgi:hypothetical protein
MAHVSRKFSLRQENQLAIRVALSAAPEKATASSNELWLKSIAGIVLTLRAAGQGTFTREGV